MCPPGSRQGNMEGDHTWNKKNEEKYLLKKADNTTENTKISVYGGTQNKNYNVVRVSVRVVQN